eukprot:gb/GEZJ01003065.1/.p1 GENE.gb/GEZJ01003065.1/~~gb/GEZJ01003065.1/.p1  ORF type:complete len:258 (-),score=37.13 gb/GEZJ01003065.1/:671-1444(-)
MLLIRDDPECRGAFIGASQTITKRALPDKKEKPADEWVYVIEKRYNDASLRPRGALEFLFDEPNCPEPPPSCHRPGAYLSSVLNGFPTSSSLPFSNYKRNGQNNHNFKEFMDEGGKKCYKLSVRDRKRVIVRAFILGLGSESEDYEILRASETTTDYSGSIGHEGGEGQFDLGSHSGLTDRKSQSTKRSFEEFQDAGFKFFESASSFFKSEEKDKEEERGIDKSRPVHDDSASALARIGYCRKLLDELSVAEAKVRE